MIRLTLIMLMAVAFAGCNAVHRLGNRIHSGENAIYEEYQHYYTSEDCNDRNNYDNRRV